MRQGAWFVFQKSDSLGNVGRIEFDPDVATSKSLGDAPDGAGAKKWVEDKVIRLGGGKDARFHKSLGKCCNMRTAGIAGVDIPNGPTISGTAILRQFFNRFLIVMVMLGFCEHEQIFMRPGGPIFHALGHDVGFVPNDVAAKKPAIILQRQCESPWDAE